MATTPTTVVVRFDSSTWQRQTDLMGHNIRRFLGVPLHRADVPVRRWPLNGRKP